MIENYDAFWEEYKNIKNKTSRRFVLLGTCVLCNRDYCLKFDKKDGTTLENFLYKRENDIPTGLIQDELPTLKSSEREVIISGICLDCQEDAFLKE